MKGKTLFLIIVLLQLPFSYVGGASGNALLLPNEGSYAWNTTLDGPPISASTYFNISWEAYISDPGSGSTINMTVINITTAYNEWVAMWVYYNSSGLRLYVARYSSFYTPIMFRTVLPSIPLISSTAGISTEFQSREIPSRSQFVLT